MTYPPDICRDLTADEDRSDMESYRKECDALCLTCGNKDCPLDTRDATTCVAYTPKPT